MSSNLTFIERIKTAWELSRRLDVLDDLATRIGALSGILERLENAENALKRSDSLLSLAERVERLDAAVRKIETLEAPKPVQETNGKTIHPVKEDLNEWNRLKLLSQFVALSGKAVEIEKEWQKIQQDENDEFFSWQVAGGEAEKKYLFKKGITEGIKWCINRFA